MSAPDIAKHRETYRHGNLKAEAVAAALRLALSGQAGAVTVRKVAEAVGVAHRSLYNHFADREALLDAVAEEGFALLAAVLSPAQGTDDFISAYVRFALAHPALYEIMKSRPHATMKLKPDLQRAAHLPITEALRIFGSAERTSAENRRAVMKILILLHGAITWHGSGILDVDGDEGLIAELQAMVKQV